MDSSTRSTAIRAALFALACFLVASGPTTTEMWVILAVVGVVWVLGPQVMRGASAPTTTTEAEIDADPNPPTERTRGVDLHLAVPQQPTEEK